MMRTITIFALLLGSSCHSDAPVSDSTRSVAALDVVLLEDKAVPTLYVEGNLVRSQPYYDALAPYFREKGGRDRNVRVMVSDTLPFSEVSAMQSELQGIGFSNIRLFVFNVVTGRMAQIEFKNDLQATPFEIPDPHNSIPLILTERK